MPRQTFCPDVDALLRGLRRPTRTLAAAIALVAALATSLSGAARADAARPYVLGGTRWPSRTITYFDTFKDARHRWAVAHAVHVWNTSGARIRFAAVARKRAKVVVSPLKARDEDGFLAGLGTLGYPGRGQKAGVWLTRRADVDQFDLAQAATHEFGHVLGLNHVAGCALMAPAGLSECPPPSDASLWPCRLIQPRDLAGVLHRYGGRSRLSTATSFCPKGPVPAGVTALTASPDAAGTVTVSWTNPPAPATKYVLAWGATCPAAPADVEDEAQPINGGGQTTTFDPLRPGRYCVEVWSLNQWGVRSSAPATAWVDVPAPAPVDGPPPPDPYGGDPLGPDPYAGEPI